MNTMTLVEMEEKLYWYACTLKRGIDGDTVEAMIDQGLKSFSLERLRFNRIDTPERGQAGYYEAKEYVASLLEGQKFYIRSYKLDNLQSRYLAEVWVSIGDPNVLVNLNDLLVEEGLAKIYRKK